MFQLKTGAIASIMTTLVLLGIGFVGSLPDGKLHVVFCDVGQGDAAYVSFPDGRDMLIDGGPGSRVLQCLGRHMSFWDKTIDIVVATHPQKDHIGGLPDVLRRFNVKHIVQSDVFASTEVYEEFASEVRSQNIPVSYVIAGDEIRIGSTEVSVLWPDHTFIADNGAKASEYEKEKSDYVLGAKMSSHLNDYSIVMRLSYGMFDVLFTGDADKRVDHEYDEYVLADERIEVLKIPHHGSQGGMSDNFIQSFSDNQKNVSELMSDDGYQNGVGYAIVSVGKNSYGHPSTELVSAIEDIGLEVKRTDELGDIEIVSDGMSWEIL